MPIKSRKPKRLTMDTCTKYDDYRSMHWSQQAPDGVDFRASQRHGIDFLVTYLQPRPNQSFKDVWHCADNAEARKLIKRLMDFADIGRVELKHKWVYVLPQGHVQFPLPGQDHDGRERVTG